MRPLAHVVCLQLLLVRSSCLLLCFSSPLLPVSASARCYALYALVGRFSCSTRCFSRFPPCLFRLLLARRWCSGLLWYCLALPLSPTRACFVGLAVRSSQVLGLAVHGHGNAPKRDAHMHVWQRGMVSDGRSKHRVLGSQW